MRARRLELRPTTMLLVMALLSCKDIAKRLDEKAKEPPLSTVSSVGTPTPVAPPTAAPSHFTRAGTATDTLRALEAAVGGDDVQALEVTFYDTHAVLQARDPEEPENVDEYVYRNGEVQKPTPVKVRGATFQASLFPLNEVSAESIPRLVEDALKKAELEDAKVSRIVVSRSRFFGRIVEMRVFVTSPRKNAIVRADAKGTILRVDPQ